MMTTTTTAPSSRPSAHARANTLVGTATLVRFMLRRDRVKLPAWAAGLGLFIVYISSALPAIAETEQELASATALFADPIGRILTGPGYGLTDPTFERFVAGGYGLYLLILAALMSILLVVRHTRVEEQTGRAELVRANVVGRHAPLSATLIVALITNLVASIAVLLAMTVVGGYGVSGSVLFAAGVGAVGLVFAGIAAITVQLSRYSRVAAGMAGAILGAAFVVRAGGDMVAQGGSALSWLSPLAWGQQTAPFVLDRWWPLALAISFAVLTAGAGYVLSARRDLAASLVPDRPGPSTAGASLGTPLGLAIRLQRGAVIGWGAALALNGVIMGVYAEPLLGTVDDMPAAFTELFGAEDMLAGYLGFMAIFAAYLAGAYTVMAVQGILAEEASGRAEPVLTTGVSRWSYLGSNLAVIAGGVLVIMVVAGVATGVAAAVVTAEASVIGDLVLAHLNLVPAVLVVLAVAALLFGFLPRVVPLAWAVVGLGMFMGTFGRMLELPQAVHNLSPYEHAAELPVEPFAPVPIVVLMFVAVSTTALGLFAFRRRDLTAT